MISRHWSFGLTDFAEGEDIVDVVAVDSVT